MESRVSKRGQTVIPAEIRKRAGIKAGARIWWSFHDGSITAVTLPEDRIRGALGLLDDYDISTTTILEERRRDRERENKDSAEVSSAAVRS